MKKNKTTTNKKIDHFRVNTPMFIKEILDGYPGARPMLCAVRDSLNKQIVKCNTYLTKRNDIGQTNRQDDKFETISYTRGKKIGLIIARDEINKLLNQTF